MAWTVNVTSWPGTASFNPFGSVVMQGGSAVCRNRKRDTNEMLYTSIIPQSLKRGERGLMQMQTLTEIPLSHTEFG